MLRYTKTTIFLVKGLKVVPKCCLNWTLNCFMMTSIVVVNTQMQSIKFRSSKLVTKSDAQMQLGEFGVGHRIHDIKYFEIGIFFSYSLNSLSTLGNHHKTL